MRLPSTLLVLVLLATGCGGAASQLVVATTIGGAGGRPMSCGGASRSPQRAFEFTAPGDGTYRFDSRTRDYDGVLAVFDANGRELGCNDDAGSTRRSRVEAFLVEGQTVHIVQGGYNGAAGSFHVQVTTGDDVAGELTIEEIGQGSYVVQ